MENHLYPICWRLFWKALTRQLLLLILGAIGAITLLNLMISGGEAAKKFAQISPPELLMILMTIAAIPLITLLVAQGLRLYSVSLQDGILHGSGYWGRKKRIPLQDITGFGTMYNNGINTLIVNSRHHGSIHISEFTAHLDDLFAQLCTHLP